MSAICDKIRESKTGIILIFSQYIEGGIVPMALALEEMGFSRYGSSANMAPSLFDESEKPFLKKDMSKYKYVMITGNRQYSPNNDEDIKYINRPENKDGDLVKVYLISRAAGEGVDFKNIRQVHIFEPWYNMNRIEQIIGRAVRNLSHCLLPFEKRNVEIFLYSTYTDNPEETVDTYVYRLAENKALKIGIVTRLMKRIAVDCILNIGQTNFTSLLVNIPENQTVELERINGEKIDYKVGDKPFTDLCDYMSFCEFKCHPNKNLTDNDEIINETYSTSFVKRNQNQILKRIRDLFKDIYNKNDELERSGRIFYKRNDLIKSVNNVKNYPVEEIYSALSYLIQNKNEYLVDKYGRKGNLVNHGEYYFFQPIEITDESASIFERSVPIPVKYKTIPIYLGKEKTKEYEVTHAETTQEVEYDNEDYTEKDIEQIINILSTNYTNATKILENQESTSNKKDWFSTFNDISRDFIDIYIGKNETEDLKKIVIEHIIVELEFIEKRNY